jgi:hypothetical protein
MQIPARVESLPPVDRPPSLSFDIKLWLKATFSIDIPATMNTASGIVGLIGFAAGNLTQPAWEYVLSPIFSPAVRMNRLKALLDAVENDLEQILEDGRALNAQFIHDNYRVLAR